MNYIDFFEKKKILEDCDDSFKLYICYIDSIWRIRKEWQTEKYLNNL